MRDIKILALVGVAGVAMAGGGTAVRAQDSPVRAHYAAYAHGLNVMNLDTALSLHAGDYRVQVDYRSAGLVGAVVGADGSTVVDGRFIGDRPVPRALFSTGHLRGDQRVTQIGWRDGSPSVIQLVPAAEAERDPVPVTQQAHTIDTLSAMAGLLQKVSTTGRCDAAMRTFDGRRLSDVAARTVGEETLDATGRSTFQGRALRCDFDGRQIGGFLRDEDQEKLRRPQAGSAWFARLQPGGPMVPVRMVFSTLRFGDMTMYIKAP